MDWAKSSLAERLQYLIDQKNISVVQCAKICAANRSQIYQILNGEVKNPQLPTLKKFIRGFKCDSDWFKNGSGEPFPDGERDSSEEEPVYVVKPRDVVPVTYVENTYASAGGGIINYESAKRVMTFDRAFLKAQLGIQNFENIHIIHAVGDSMEPSIHSGDMLFVNPGEKEIVTGAVYVFVVGDETMVKRVERNPISGELTLRSNNEQYEPLKIQEKDLKKVHVIGRVIGNFRKL